MNTKDTARCQRAINLAKSGQKQKAYEQFTELYYRYPEDITLLIWIAYTTPSHKEAQDTIAIIAHLEPHHPKLQELQLYADKMQQNIPSAPSSGNFGPKLQCPYCHHVQPALIKQKIAVGGWIWFSIFLFLFLCSLSTIAVSQTSTMGCMTVFFLLISFIGLFFKKRSYACGHCGITLGAIS